MGTTLGYSSPLLILPVAAGMGATFVARGGQVSGYVMRREMQRGQVDGARG